jgi:integrase
VTRAEAVLREFACFLANHAPEVARVADIRRAHIEAYKLQLAARPSARGGRLSKLSLADHLGCLRTCFERLSEWQGPDTPAGVLVFAGDLPLRDEPLPRFLDDGAAAKLLQAARADPDPFVRLCVEFLARTGLRKGELLDLTVDAVVQIGSAYWLHVPVGKLRTDRYIPLHPQFKDLLDGWLARRPAGLRSDYLFVERGRRIGQGAVDRGCGQGRPGSRHRPRHPPPAAPHPGHPGDQPWHVVGGDRRPAGASLDADDHGVCPHRRPHRRRGVLQGLGQGRGPLRRP